jgi:hypothetical protein
MMGIKDRQFAPLPDLSLEELVPGITRTVAWRRRSTSRSSGSSSPRSREERMIPVKMYDRQSANVSLPGAGSRGGGKG